MIKELQYKIKTLAVLDAIVSPEWQYRYFSYNSKWGTNIEMGSFRDGSGDEWFLWLKGDLAGYKSYSKGDKKIGNYDEILKACPTEYKDFMKEPAFTMEDSTSIWYLEKEKWKKFGQQSRNEFDLEEVIKWTPKDYVEWASEYYEKKINLPAAKNIFLGDLSTKNLKAINPELKQDVFKKDLAEINL